MVDGGASDDTVVRAVRNLSKMTLGRVAVQALMVVSALVIPSVLDLEAFGRYAAIMSLAAILEVVSSGGLHLAEIRFLAPAWRRPDRESAVTLGSSIWTARLVLSGVVGLIGLAWMASSSTLGSEPTLVLAAVLVIAIRSALEATRQLFLSIGLIGRLVLFEAMRAAATLIVVVVVYSVFGLTAVFLCLAIVLAAVLSAAIVALRAVAPFSVGRFRWSVFRPMIGFGALTLIGIVAWIVQAHFAVYAVANWISLEQAAVVGLTVQVYVMAQSLIISPWASLTPIMAELDASGQTERLREWGSVMMRWGTGIGVVAALSWAVLGDEVLSLLPAAFAPVHESGTIMMVAVVVLSGAVLLNNLIYVSGFAGVGSVNAVLFAVSTILGSALLLANDGDSIASSLAWVYVGSAVLYVTGAYVGLVVRTGMWLPLRRTILLGLPVAVAWPAVAWDAPLVAELVVLVVGVSAYWLASTRVGLIPMAEFRRLRQAARPGVTPPSGL